MELLNSFEVLIPSSVDFGTWMNYISIYFDLKDKGTDKVHLYELLAKLEMCEITDLSSDEDKNMYQEIIGLLNIDRHQYYSEMQNGKTK